MKKFLSIILLLFSVTDICFCNQEVNRKSVKESVLSNGVKVFLCEDFRTPIAVVSFIFSIGLLDVPLTENATLILTSEGLIGKKLRNVLNAYNISCDVNVYRDHVKIIATMDPDYVYKFLQLVCENFGKEITESENFNIAKKRLILNKKLERIHGVGVIYESVIPNINVKGKNTSNILITESLINSVTADTCKTFYNNYLRTCPMAVVVIGAVGYKNLIKSLQATVSGLPKRREIPFVPCELETQCAKSISISSKFIKDSIGYVYKIPSGTDLYFLNMYFAIFFQRLRKFLQYNSYPLLEGFSIDDLQAGDIFRLIYLFPKNDVSCAKLISGYDKLLYSMSKEAVSTDELSQISEHIDLMNKIDSVNLYSTLDSICTAYLHGYDPNNIYMLPVDIKAVNPEMIMKFTDDTLLPNLIMKVKSKYRADK